jgi:hypothetical protein
MRSGSRAKRNLAARLIFTYSLLPSSWIFEGKLQTLSKNERITYDL